MDHRNESYYNDLLWKITEFKTKNNQRTHSKTLSFIENVIVGQKFPLAVTPWYWFPWN